MRSLLLIALALPIGGCDFEAKDIDSWGGIAGGVPRLAGYMADPQRPMELRQRAARNLFDAGQLAPIMGVLARAQPADRVALAGPLAALAQERMKAGGEREAVRGAGLGYFLLERPADLGAQADPLAAAVADWALARVPMLPTHLGGAVRPDHALLGAAIARPKVVHARIVATAEAATSEEQLLALEELASRLRAPDLDQQMAALLLARARADYPKITPRLAGALRANGNETLLKFLLELTRDPRQSPKVRGEGFNASMRLGPKAIPGLLRILQTDLPANDDARWLALRDIWEKGGPKQLGAALRALPPEGQWAEEGTELKDEIDGFCDNRLAEKAAEVRSVLAGLLEDPNWVARAFAMECIIRLYPDDAATLLEPLAEDLTPLAGWDESGEPTSFAAVVKALAEG